MSIIFDRDHYSAVIQNGILKAESFVWIATANVKDLHVIGNRKSHPLLKDFALLAEKGVVIRMLYAKDPSDYFKRSFDRFDTLVKGGIELQPCPRMHSKIVIVDGSLAYFGSANLTGAGLGARSGKRHNFEAGILTEDKKEIQILMEYFDNIWMGSECAACGLRDKCEEPIV